MTQKVETQKAEILQHLKKRGGITAIDALNRYGCFRLAARIYDLRWDGHKIRTDWQEVGDKRVARYWLVA